MLKLIIEGDSVMDLLKKIRSKSLQSELLQTEIDPDYCCIPITDYAEIEHDIYEEGEDKEWISKNELMRELNL